MTLRRKLLIAQCPLAIALVVLWVVGSSTITSLGDNPDLILRENYRSVLAAHGMKEMIARLESAALRIAAGRPDSR